MTVSPTLKQEATISEQAVPASDPISRLGPGSHLKTAREARRMTIDEVANRLRLTKNMVMDIEADNYNSRLAFTFIKGYLRAYARLVHVPPEVVLKAFEQLNLKEHKGEFVLPKVPMTTWRVEENYVRLATYGIAGLLALIVIGFSGWWLMQPRTPEPVSQDLVKLLNNVDGADKRTSLMHSSTPKTSGFNTGISSAQGSAPVISNENMSTPAADNVMATTDTSANANAAVARSTTSTTSDEPAVATSEADNEQSSTDNRE